LILGENGELVGYKVADVAVRRGGEPRTHAPQIADVHRPSCPSSSRRELRHDLLPEEAERANGLLVSKHATGEDEIGDAVVDPIARLAWPWSSSPQRCEGSSRCATSAGGAVWDETERGDNVSNHMDGWDYAWMPLMMLLVVVAVGFAVYVGLRLALHDSDTQRRSLR
jgi:hypothetical protein